MKPTLDTNAPEAREIVRFLADRGIGHIFGLPGSSLAPLVQELSGSSIRIIATIHESVTIAAADGYARVGRASKVPAWGCSITRPTAPTSIRLSSSSPR